MRLLEHECAAGQTRIETAVLGQAHLGQTRDDRIGAGASVVEPLRVARGMVQLEVEENDARHPVVQIILDARRPQWIGGPRSTVRRLDARGTDPALGAERDVEVRMSGARHARRCIAFHAKTRRQDDA